ncbi:phytase [Aquisphaera insulae]|uniref:phytase n=1 Tax=Aquisphaera insulae TaxID=2712864 RepID=UPI0013EA903C|nr:phytase [Aquisphaera insulae]
MPATRSLLVLSILLAPAIAGGAWRDDLVVLTPTAAVETEPVPSEGDAADDPAIWIHPVDPARSLVLGTDKKGGLHAYSLDGRCRQAISPDCRPNNVDLLYGFDLGGKKVDLAVATIGKGSKATGVKVWTIDPGEGRLAELGANETFRTFGGGIPYGICTYRSPKDGAAYVLVTDREGAFEQYRLAGSSSDGSKIEATRVRAFRVGSQAEGIVADRQTGRLYIGEEDVGIWEYGAEPGDGEARRIVARVGENGLKADVEGLAIYYARDGKGYLLASSQGNSTVIAYERSGDHAYVATIDPKPGTTEDIDETDGLDVTNERTSSRFPNGFLVVQDGKCSGHQNFKVFAWDEVAGGRLIVDTLPHAR